jgi:hypothetical protein
MNIEPVGYLVVQKWIANMKEKGYEVNYYLTKDNYWGKRYKDRKAEQIKWTILQKVGERFPAVWWYAK